MKPEEIERKFRDYVNSKEDTERDVELQNLLNTRIWARIEKNISPGFKIQTFWWAAASIIGIIMTVSLYAVIHKDNEIARLKTELAKQEIANKTVLSQVTQIQYKLELAQRNIPKIDTIYKTQIIYKSLNEKDNIITACDPIAIYTDTIEKTTELLYSIGESTLSDSLKTKELNNLNTALVNSIQASDSTTEIIHFRIDFGEMKFDKYNSERSWKLVMTYL